MTGPRTRRATARFGGLRIILASAITSAGLCLALAAAHFAFGSELALAQAVDSLLDVITATGLMWTLRVSRRPPDEDHPFGHQDAQPIASLIVAVLTGMLALQVGREAVTTLLHGSSLRLGWMLVGAIGAKVLAKSAFVWLAGREARAAGPRGAGTVLLAFRVDARNDVLMGVSSLVGLAAAGALDVPVLDAWLALPVAVWIAYSGVNLALESTKLLMGEAPSTERQQALRQVAGEVQGVVRIEALKARQQGNGLHVWIEIRVDPDASVRQGHDLGERVKDRLLAEGDVADVVVHVDAA